MFSGLVTTVRSRGVASMSMADVEMANVGKKKMAKMTKEEEEEDVGNMSRHGLIALVTYVSCAALACTAILAIMAASEHTVLIYMSMSVGILTSANCVQQRCRLEERESLRQVLNRTRLQANEFAKSNTRLKLQNDTLKLEHNRLTKIETSLTVVLNRQRQNVHSFVQSVKNNQLIMDDMKDCLVADVLQMIIETVVKSDRDQDFHIDPEEVDMLILRLQQFDGLYVREHAFRKKMKQQGYSIHSVLTICKNLMDGSSSTNNKNKNKNNKTTDEEDVFQISTKQLQSSSRRLL